MELVEQASTHHQWCKPDDPVVLVCGVCTCGKHIIVATCIEQVHAHLVQDQSIRCSQQAM